MSIDTIDDGFKMFSEQPSNLNEHFPALKIYAQQCATIAQFGCSDLLSCWPLLQGLVCSSASEKKLVCFDKNTEPEPFAGLKRVAKKQGVRMVYVCGSTLSVDLTQPVDMLLIDTFHAYAQLKRELERHHHNVRKYIAILNTSVDADTSELVRLFYYYDIDQTCKDIGCSHADVCKGLAPAIEDFLSANSTEWKTHKTFENNNGLVVLQRVTGGCTA